MEQTQLSDAQRGAFVGEHFCQKHSAFTQTKTLRLFSAKATYLTCFVLGCRVGFFEKTFEDRVLNLPEGCLEVFHVSVQFSAEVLEFSDVADGKSALFCHALIQSGEISVELHQLCREPVFGRFLKSGKFSFDVVNVLQHLNFCWSSIYKINFQKVQKGFVFCNIYPPPDKPR